MQQRFNTRNYSVRDFEEWQERDELVLAPKFQRRDVWSPKARSFLIDTILLGKPIPKIYMRQEVNPATRRTIREIVDGQQRLRTVLTFLKDGFKISRSHSREFGGKTYSMLPKRAQGQILQYEFVVDLLQDMEDADVYDVFARINTYAEKLKPQELRNAKYFGDFKSAAYDLAKNTLTFLTDNKVFTAKQILRMSEVEWISDLLIAMEEGIREGNKKVRDNAYTKYDDSFPHRRAHEKRFLETVDAVAGVAGKELPTLPFRAPRLLYPLFCAVYHLKFGLRRFDGPRAALKPSMYPKCVVALDQISELVTSVDDGKKAAQADLSAEDRRFYDAYSVHWVHADKRTTMTSYIVKRLVKAIRQ